MNTVSLNVYAPVKLVIRLVSCFINQIMFYPPIIYQTNRLSWKKQHTKASFSSCAYFRYFVLYRWMSCMHKNGKRN